jgi:hypothetical protein
MAADEPDLVRVKLTFWVESVNTWMCSFFFPVVFILILLWLLGSEQMKDSTGQKSLVWVGTARVFTKSGL